MHFSKLLFSLALSAGLAVAGPVADASTPAITVVNGVKTPEFTEVESHAQPSPAGAEGVVVIGSEGETNGVSKREEYNPLDERAAPLLILCSGARCNGKCYATNLNSVAFNRCYSAHAYNSVWVKSKTGLHYGVYVGSGCRGMFLYSVKPFGGLDSAFSRCNFVALGVLVPHVGTCYQIHPTGHTVFKKH